MSDFKTRIDYSNNRQLKQFQLTNTILSGTTTFGVDDVYIPENITGNTINIDALQFIQTRGLLFPSPNPLPTITGTTNTVLARGTDGVVGEKTITDLDTVFQGTYSELTDLINTNSLIVGNTYILTDYKTIYQIENTNTSDIIELHTILGPSGDYAYFGSPGISSDSLKNGDVVEIVELPDGYGGGHYVGELITTYDFFNTSYIRFTPTTNEAGIVIKIKNQRYPQFTGDTTITDLSGNTVMQAGGVLNTEVHNDLPYMNMSAAENPSPKIEEIVLKAIEINKFSIEAQSLTFLGDTLLYYFEDNIIYDENNLQIGTRNGLIKKREAFDLNISVDKDWRTQRYRRWKVDNEIWSEYTLNKDLYKIGVENMCTTVNNTIGDGHKYIAPSIENNNFYLDFYLSGNTDPFLSGVTTAPTVGYGERASNDIASEYTKDIILPTSGLTEAKDFHIFPILNEEPTSFTPRFKVDSLTNTVCLTESQRYGNSSNYFVNAKGVLSNSTFMSGCYINSDGGTINKVTSIDSCSVNVGGLTSHISRLNIFSFGTIINNGYMANCMVGGSRNTGVNDYTDIAFDSGCSVYNSIFGSIRSDNMDYVGLKANKLLCKIRYGGNGKMSGNVYLTHLQTNPNTWGHDIHLQTWVDVNPVKGIYGYFYDVTGEITDKYVTNLYGNKNLIHQLTDELNVVQLITKSTLQ